MFNFIGRFFEKIANPYYPSHSFEEMCADHLKRARAILRFNPNYVKELSSEEFRSHPLMWPLVLAGDEIYLASLGEELV